MADGSHQAAPLKTFQRFRFGGSSSPITFPSGSRKVVIRPKRSSRIGSPRTPRVASSAPASGPVAFARATGMPQGKWDGGAKRIVRALLPHRPDAFGFEALHGVQDHPTRASAIRGEVQATGHPMDEKTRGVEHLFQFRERVSPNGRAVFPRALAIDDDLPRLEAPLQ